MSFVAGCLIGLFVGANVGILVAAMCAASSRGDWLDEGRGKDQQDERGRW
jgi:hypothetical protein